MSNSGPDLVLVFSGKRKSGKDYICQRIGDALLQNSRPVSLETVTLSAPLKEIYARENGLDYERLLDSTDYKEKYRLDMIEYRQREDLCYSKLNYASLKLNDII